MDSHKKQRRKVFKLLPNLGVPMTFVLTGHTKLRTQNFTSKSTEQKVHAHMSNCQKDFACCFRQHKWTMGNILHFVVLAILI